MSPAGPADAPADSALAQASRRLILLNQVATSLMVSDTPRETLREAFDAVARELGAKYYLYYRVDDAEPEFLTLEAAGGVDIGREPSLQKLRIGQNTSGSVAQMREPLILSDVDRREDPQAARLRARGVRAYAAFPLMAHGNLFGTIAFGSISQGAFSDADVELLKMLVNQFSLALDRMRLVKQLRDSETRYRGAVITGRIAAWETDMVLRKRFWTEEGMALFGLDLPNGIGVVGGENDEFQRALHPDDKHMMAVFHRTADEVDSYPCDYRIVRPDGRTLWVSGRGRVVARDADGKCARVANIVVDVTERRKAEEHVQFLMREMSHRSKNLLAVVQAIATRTARNAGSLAEFERRFVDRLRGLAASNDLLLHESWRGAALGDLARKQLAPFAEAGTRLKLGGPDVILTAEATQAVGLALHELATNATKYGAWSVPNGTVAVSWDFQPSAPHRLELGWTERGGPPVTPAERKGFGSFLIETMAAQSVRGDVTMDYDSAGLRWTLAISPDCLVSPDAPAEPARA